MSSMFRKLGMLTLGMLIGTVTLTPLYDWLLERAGRTPDTSPVVVRMRKVARIFWFIVGEGIE